MGNKVRIYQLAKELNTTSKRLIEKLTEIDIEVKNHMSLITEDELKALYEHIGVVNQNTESPEKQEPVPAKQETNKSSKPEVSRGPTIIRKTAIILDDNTDNVDGEQAKNKKPTRKRKRRDYVKVADDTTGLRAGLVRNTGNALEDLKEMAMASRKNNPVKTEEKEKEQKQPDLDNKTNENVEKKTPVAEIKTVNKENKANKENKDNRAKSVDEPLKEVKDTNKETDVLHVKNEKVSNEESKQKVIDSTNEKTVIEDNIKEEKEKLVSVNTQKTIEIEKNDDVKVEVSPKPGSKPKQNDRKKETNNTKIEEDKKPEDKKNQMKKTLIIPPVNSDEREKGRMNKKSDKSNDKTLRKEKDNIQETNRPARNRKTRDVNIIIPKKKDVSELLSDDFDLEEQLMGHGRKRRPKNRKTDANTNAVPKQKKETIIKIPETITVKDLAERLKKTAGDVIKKLMAAGLMVTINEEIDFDTASIIADEYGIKVEQEIVINDEDILFDDSEENEEDLEPRAPVVVVMGHVDHGKTSLLDAIRQENVIETEAGGITQHIGAYTVKINDREITFLDTPGHEAFTSMRARGAQVTDIAILVVAADDGVMPQTVEAINHAKAANVTIIVAINKIDKHGADVERIKQQLTEYGLVAEEWGGDTVCVPISAKNRQNIDQLLEMVILSADLLELKANPNKQAKGTIIEAKLDKNRGTIATLLVQRGTLKTGDSIVTGTIVGRIRAMVDDKGREITSAGPSVPVEILGLPEVPEAGEIFYAIEDEHVAKHLVETRKAQQREEQLKSSHPVTLEDLFNQIQEGNVKELNLIIKADVQGSVEALKQSLLKLSNDEVKINIVHGAVGAITESDVTLAEVANAIVIGFNVRPGINVTETAERVGVDIRLYRVIYTIIEDIEAAMKGLLDPTYKEVVTGHAEIRQVFRVSGVGSVAGSYVTDGKIARNSEVRLVRDGIVIFEGKLASLRRFKDDVREVQQGYECGIGLERFNDIKEGDIIEAFVMEEIER